jgi:hypothetical protein
MEFARTVIPIIAIVVALVVAYRPAPKWVTPEILHDWRRDQQKLGLCVGVFILGTAVLGMNFVAPHGQ